MSAAVAAAAAAATCCSPRNSTSSGHTQQQYHDPVAQRGKVWRLGRRYESQKRREWKSFVEYMRERRGELVVSGYGGAHVVEFLKHLHHLHHHHTNQQPYWGSVEALVGRLRAAFDEISGGHHPNPFASPELTLYLTQLRDHQQQ